MSRGFLSGVAMGAVLSGVGLAGLSLLSPPPAQMPMDHASDSAMTKAMPGTNTEVPTGTGQDAADPAPKAAPEADLKADPIAETGAVDTARAGDASDDQPSDSMEEAASSDAPQTAPQTSAQSEAPAAPMAPTAGNNAEAAATLGEQPVAKTPAPKTPSGADVDMAPVKLPAGPAAKAADNTSELVTPAASNDDTALAATPKGTPAPLPPNTTKAPTAGLSNGSALPQAPAPQTAPPAAQTATEDQRAKQAGEMTEGADAPKGDEIKSAPVAPIGNLAKNVTIGRLPTIGADGAGEVASDLGSDADNLAKDQSETAPKVAANNAPATAPGAASDADAKSATDASPLAIKRNAVAFSREGDRPIMAVLLLDQGGDRAALPPLSSLPFPVTIAVDATAADAQDAIDFYKSAGAEVVIEASLPPAATPSDAEVNFQVQQEMLDQGAAVIMSLESGFQEDPALAKQVSAILSESGHGVISHPKGLNTGHRLAIKAGVPAGTLFRDVDGAGQDGRAIRRFMDNAAFKARQQDGVIVLGRARPATVQALIEWSLGNRAKSVALAPVSAVLLGEDG